jgi:hypothetical protein
VRLVSSRTALASVTIPLMGFLLHGDVLCRPSVMGLGIHAQLLVKKGQLLVELVPGLREFIESRPPLGVGDAEPALVRSCSMRRPRKRCIPAWGDAVA